MQHEACDEDRRLAAIDQQLSGLILMHQQLEQLLALMAARLDQIDKRLGAVIVARRPVVGRPA